MFDLTKQTLDSNNREALTKELFSIVASDPVVDDCKGENAFLEMSKIAQGELESIVNNYKNCPLIVTKKHKCPAYSPEDDEIVLPLKYWDNTMMSKYFSDLYHEMAHSTMHKSRLDRSINFYNTEQRGVEEAMADISALMLTLVAYKNIMLKDDSKHSRHINISCGGLLLKLATDTYAYAKDWYFVKTPEGKANPNEDRFQEVIDRCIFQANRIVAYILGEEDAQ